MSTMIHQNEQFKHLLRLSLIKDNNHSKLETAMVIPKNIKSSVREILSISESFDSSLIVVIPQEICGLGQK